MGFSTPSVITSDRGSQFVSELWRHFSTFLGVELHQTTAYHPQANGLVERFHRDLKASLRTRLKTTGDNWTDQLPWVLLGLRTAFKEDLQTSSAELVFGEPLTVPGDFVSPSTDASDPAHLLRHLQEEVQQLRPIPTSRHGQQPSHVLDDVKTADHVFVPRNGHKGPLQLYSGPYRVLQSGDKMFRIDVGGCEDTVTVDRLKHAHGDNAEPTVPARPPRRGRPPNFVPPQPPPPPPLDSAEFLPLKVHGRVHRQRQFYEPKTGTWIGAFTTRRVVGGPTCPMGSDSIRSGGL